MSILESQVIKKARSGSPGLVAMGGDSYPEDLGFDSQHYILDEPFSHIFVIKIVMFVKRRK